MHCCLKEKKKMCFGNWLNEDDYTQQFSINEQSGPKIVSYVNTVVYLKSELSATHCFNFQVGLYISCENSASKSAISNTVVIQIAAQMQK